MNDYEKLTDPKMGMSPYAGSWNALPKDTIVEQSNEEDANSRSAHIFYDNAQNVYDTKTPKWSEFGIDMRGRSTIMRESFRSTTPITELAVNVLNRLSATKQRQDQQELLSLGLLKARPSLLAQSFGAPEQSNQRVHSRNSLSPFGFVVTGQIAIEEIRG